MERPVKASLGDALAAPVLYVVIQSSDSQISINQGIPLRTELADVRPMRPIMSIKSNSVRVTHFAGSSTRCHHMRPDMLERPAIVTAHFFSQIKPPHLPQFHPDAHILLQRLLDSVSLHPELFQRP